NYISEIYENPSENINRCTFQISKYPVTNAQFQMFVDDPNGYSNLEWWNFLGDRLSHFHELEPPTVDFEKNPRTMISWYDSIAFCKWLSSISGQSIILPTQKQLSKIMSRDLHYIDNIEQIHT